MFEQLTEHIYAFPCDGYTDRPNIGLITGSRYALLFDAGNSAAHVQLMRAALEGQGLPQPDFVALSHWHWDHTFGAAFWEAPVLAGRQTDAQLRKMTAWRWDDASMQRRVDDGEEIVFCTEMIKREYPDRSKIKVAAADLAFDGELTLDLGGVTCRLLHAQGPHAADSVICYVPEERFVLLGDSNCKDLYGLPWHFDIAHEEDFVPVTQALPYDPEKTAQYLRLLDTLDFSACLSGHAPVMPRAALYAELQTVDADGKP